MINGFWPTSTGWPARPLQPAQQGPALQPALRQANLGLGCRSGPGAPPHRPPPGPYKRWAVRVQTLTATITQPRWWWPPPPPPRRKPCRRRALKSRSAGAGSRSVAALVRSARAHADRALLLSLRRALCSR